MAASLRSIDGAEAGIGQSLRAPQVISGDPQDQVFSSVLRIGGCRLP
jgi:hypothetical protein